MKSKIHNGMIVLNKKNINNILDYFCENSDLGLEYIAGMINMINLFGIIVYRKQNEWVMEDLNRNEIGRKTIDIDEDI